MTTHTVIEFGCWYCRLSCWIRHRFGRCHSFCSYCITEADKFLEENDNGRQEANEAED